MDIASPAGLLQGLLLAGAITFACSPSADAASGPPFCQANDASPAGETAPPLTAATDRRSYQRKEILRLCVRLTNASAKTIYVRKDAGWGESSSVSIWIVDAESGKEANSDFMPDEIDPPPNNDQLAAVGAGGQLFWGFDVPLAEYKLQRGHRYKAWVIYHGNLLAPGANGSSPQVTGRIDARAFSLPFLVN